MSDIDLTATDPTFDPALAPNDGGEGRDGFSEGFAGDGSDGGAGGGADGGPFEAVEPLPEGALGGIKEAMAAADPAAFDALSAEWGSDGNFSANVAVVRHVVSDMPDDTVAFFESLDLDGRPLAHHPAFIKALAVLGRRALGGDAGGDPMSSRGGASGGSQATPTQRAQVRDKVDQLTQQAHAALSVGDKRKADRLFRQRDALDRKAFGSASLVGADLRRT